MNSEPSHEAQQIPPQSLEYLQFEDRPAGVVCPACGQSLLIAQLDGIKIAACSACRGMLLESQAMAVLVQGKRAEFRGLEDAPLPVDPVQLNQRRNCPACGQTFDTHPYYGPGNVIIDSCIACGLVWLDRGELGQMIRAPGQRE